VLREALLQPDCSLQQQLLQLLAEPLPQLELLPSELQQLWFVTPPKPLLVEKLDAQHKGEASDEWVLKQWTARKGLALFRFSGTLCGISSAVSIAKQSGGDARVTRGSLRVVEREASSVAGAHLPSHRIYVER
jgi:hypothetical protein